MCCDFAPVYVSCNVYAFKAECYREQTVYWVVVFLHLASRHISVHTCSFLLFEFWILTGKPLPNLIINSQKKKKLMRMYSAIIPITFCCLLKPYTQWKVQPHCKPEKIIQAPANQINKLNDSWYFSQCWCKIRRPLAPTFRRHKREIHRVTIYLVSQKPCQASYHVQALSPHCFQSHCTVICVDFRSQWGLNISERGILQALLSKFRLDSFNGRRGNYFSLTQEVSQLGSECRNTFYTAMAMPDGVVVLIKGFCRKCMWKIWGFSFLFLFSQYSWRQNEH